MICNNGQLPEHVRMSSFVTSPVLNGLPQLVNCITETRTGPGFHFQTNDKHHQPRRCVIQLTLEGSCQCAVNDSKKWWDIQPGQAVAFIQPLERFTVAYPPNATPP